MLPLFQILIVLAMAIVAVVFVTSRNPTRLSEEQYAKYGKILRFLVPLALLATAIKFFVMN